MISWVCAPFAALTGREVHDILQARAAVFVVEQACAFQDVDGADPASWHLVGRSGAQGSLVAYARLIPAGIKFAEVSIGRVVTTDAVRGTGMGRVLMDQAIAECEKLWPGVAIRIGAQQRLERFYASLGFATVSAPYDEDGIQHVEMLRAASTADRDGMKAARTTTNRSEEGMSSP